MGSGLRRQDGVGHVPGRRHESRPNGRLFRKANGRVDHRIVGTADLDARDPSADLRDHRVWHRGGRRTLVQNPDASAAFYHDAAGDPLVDARRHVGGIGFFVQTRFREVVAQGDPDRPQPLLLHAEPGDGRDDDLRQLRETACRYEQDGGPGRRARHVHRFVRGPDYFSGGVRLWHGADRRSGVDFPDAADDLHADAVWSASGHGVFPAGDRGGDHLDDFADGTDRDLDGRRPGLAAPAGHGRHVPGNRPPGRSGQPGLRRLRAPGGGHHPVLRMVRLGGHDAVRFL